MFSAPKPIATDHIVNEFDCGATVLNEWLHQRAMGNQASGASRTFVVVDGLNVVVGYYALAAGAVSHAVATNAIRRNMPDPIPVMVLGRLAVDKRAKGRGLGASLLQDAVNRVHGVAKDAGVRALLVHALDENAKLFYERYGFKESSLEEMTLMIKIQFV